MLAAIDFGLTNIDILLRRGDDLRSLRLAASRQPVLRQLQHVLGEIQHPADPIEKVAVTGGQYRNLPDQYRQIPLVKVSEVVAIGLGGLQLAQLERALVVSAGSGTAMVAARGREAYHVTGVAVGGGTLQGLGRLLLGTADALKIDRLAMTGDANQADLTLVEAVGGAVGRLPLDANAVNFGRLARKAVDLSPADLAAALVRLVGQVITMVAINAARSEDLEHIVVIGHLVDLPSVCKVLTDTAGYYGASIRVPPAPGTGTAMGALMALEVA